MLESIRVADVSTFRQDWQELDELREINFIFGSNGVGKTTISRIIAEPKKYSSCRVIWKAARILQPLVYNRDFIDRNFSQSSEVKGVFTLGEENQDILDKIDKLKIKRNDLLSKFSNLNTKSKEWESKRDRLSQKFEKKCWSQKSKHDENLKGAFEGYRKSAAKFKDKVVQEYASVAYPFRSAGSRCRIRHHV